jgi:hypothetical protein
VIAEPPLLAGAVKVTVACVSPAVATPMTGAPGTIALTVNERVSCGAAWKAALPAWSALMVQVPAVTNVRAPALVMVHTAVVADVKVGVNPDEAVAVSVGVVPKFCAAGVAKVMVWAALGVTEFDAAEAGPGPTPLVAMTVNVYAVPLVRPITVMGDAAPDAVKPPGLEVTV